jgi:hypothetical protein
MLSALNNMRKSISIPRCVETIRLVGGDHLEKLCFRTLLPSDTQQDTQPIPRLRKGGRLALPSTNDLEVTMIISGTALSLQCFGTIIGNDPASILDGRTATKPASVGLATGTLEPFTGTRWLALPVPGGSSNQFFLECLGDVDGPRFLDGRTEDGTVGLAPTTNLS